MADSEAPPPPRVGEGCEGGWKAREAGKAREAVRHVRTCVPWQDEAAKLPSPHNRPPPPPPRGVGCQRVPWRDQLLGYDTDPTVDDNYPSGIESQPHTATDVPRWHRRRRPPRRRGLLQRASGRRRGAHSSPAGVPWPPRDPGPPTPPLHGASRRPRACLPPSPPLPTPNSPPLLPVGARRRGGAARRGGTSPPSESDPLGAWVQRTGAGRASRREWVHGERGEGGGDSRCSPIARPAARPARRPLSDG